MSTLPLIETTEQALHQLSHTLDDEKWKQALRFLKEKYDTLDAAEKGRVDEQIWNGVFIHGYYPADIDVTSDISFEIVGGNRCQIGKGAAGTVYNATLHNRAVAVKILNREGDAVKQLLNTPNNHINFFREIQKWKSIQRHDNVLPFIGYVFRQNVEIGLVSPLAEGDLEQWIPQNPDTGPRDRYKLIDGIAQGLSHLHSQVPVLVHGDLRASNIFLMNVDGQLTVMIGDFGISKLGESEGSLTMESNAIRSTLNVRWLAYELILNKYAPRNKLTDLFAFARTITEIFSGQVPFSEIARDELQTHVLNHELPTRSPDIHDSVWNLMTQYWSVDANKRGTASQMSDCIRDHELASSTLVPIEVELSDIDLLPKGFM